MEWRYLIKQFILPPGGFIALSLLCIWLLSKRPRLARSGLLIAVLGLWLVSTPALVYWLAKPLESHPPLDINIAKQKNADAIVILGGGREVYPAEWGGDEVSVNAMQRVRYGAKLARATGLPIVASGGLHYGKPPSEAYLMAKVLVNDFNLAIPILEEQSRTTWENATKTANILLPGKQKNILLVTHSWHMQRSVWSYEKQGFNVIPAPTAPYAVKQSRPFWGLLPEANALRKNTQLINEYLGLLLYRLFY